MGYSVVTTVISPAASYDLTDLNTVKDELSIAADDTSNDAWLERAITQVSKAIERHIKRPAAPEQLQDVFDIEQDPYPYQTPGGFAQLQLSRWPVLGVASVVQTLAGGSSPTTQTLVAGTDYRLDARTGQLLRLSPFTGVVTSWEAIPVAVTYTAGYGALVQETGAVPSSSPFQVEVAKASAFSCDQGVAYANGTAFQAVGANPAQGQYSVDDGVYVFNPADASQPLGFGYATLDVPDDLVAICLELITGRFRGRARDPLLIQREQPGGVGSERYWFDTSQKSKFPPEIQDALEDYRVPTVA